MRKIFVSNWSTILILGVIAILSSFTILSVAPSLFKTQIVYFSLGFGIYFLVAKIHPSYFQYFSKFFYAGSVLLLAVTLLGGVFVKGSVRWVDFFGIRFQPSEIIKPFLIIFFASELANAQKSLKFFLKQILYFLLVAGFVFKQPDLGNFIIYSLIFMSMVVFSKIRIVHVFIFFAVIVVMLPVAALFLKPYQKDRLTSFLNPAADPQGIAYHQIQSMITVGNGGFFGQGITRGSQTHLMFLPEKETDFIFASFSEEFGFVGALLLLSCYYILFFKLIYLILRAEREFDRMLLSGIFAYLFFQCFIHVGMNVGIMPVTGITLPLFSAGGSSITSVLFTLGLVAFYEKNIV